MQKKVKILTIVLLSLVGILSGCGTKDTKVDSTTEKKTVTSSKNEDTSSGKEKTASKFFSNLGEKIPFQEGTFDSENSIDPEKIDITSSVGSLADFDVIEKGSKTEVIWAAYNDEGFGDGKISAISVYRAFSNENGWDKSEKLGTFKLESGKSDIYLIGNTLYLQNGDITMGAPKILTQVVFDDSGKIQSQKEIKYQDYVDIGTTEKGRAISIDNKIYTSDNIDAPIEVQDKYDLFSATDGFYLNEKTSKLYVKNMELGLIQMDIKTGEPLYDSEGKEATYGSTGVSGIATEALIGGFDDVAIYDQFETTTSSASENLTAVLSEPKQLIEAASFNLPVEGADSSAQYMSRWRVTETKDELHFWRITKFQHKTVLKQVVAGKELGKPMD